jgi:EAL domain-containing protein (putative c-di-GMP-specific phosphodiesterase class I)/DNA-binding response OmpR family regulator
MRKPQVTRVLLMEDDPSGARAVTSALTQAAPGFDVVRAADLPDALQALQDERFDVVLVDARALAHDGMLGLDSLRILAGGAPLAVLADAADAAVHAAALEHGASAVLPTGGSCEQLLQAVRALVGTDTFEQAVKEHLRAARRDGTNVAVVQVHVPDWAEVTAGRTAQELVVLTHAVTERLAGRLAVVDTLMALGDGRYGVIAPGTRTAHDAQTVADDLVRALERPVALSGDAVVLMPACSWTLAPVNAPTADVAVAASVPGANPVQAAPPGASPVQAAPPAVHEAPPGPRRGFAERLRAAIDNGELVLHYQPIIRLGDDTIQVVEALVRWRVPTAEGGTRYLPPAEFIPLAEETGAIEEIGAFALREACRQLREWDGLGLKPFRVAVNLSARELCSPELPARVADALAESGLPAHRLELELTESMFADPDETSKMLRRLRTLGVRVAIDDFGTGYSSLGYLTRFAVDVIKIDGAFVRRAADRDGAEVLRGIVSIAHQLDLEVVAEGVETVEQLQFVKDEAVDLVQGFLFCEPLPAEAAGAWLIWAEQIVQANVVAPPATSVVLDRHERLIRGAALTVGAVLGAFVTWPVKMPAASACPPAGEGLLFCQVQHGWAPALTLFMVIMTATYLAIDLARLLLERSRSGLPLRRVSRRRRHQALPPADADPVLLAASWGVTAPPKTAAAVAAAAVAAAAVAAAEHPVAY